jgi:glycosyltransferase involved in cell wall biosynthesis
MNSQLGFISYALDRAPGGIGRYTKELIAALRRAGVPLTILQAGRARHCNGTVGLPGAGLLPALLTLGQVEIAWAAHQRRLALVHDPTGSVPLMLTRAQRVATIHDVIPYIYPETSTALDRLIYRYWLPLAVPRLDAIITESQQSKVDIVRHLSVKPEDVIVIPAAAGTNYQPTSQAKTDHVLARHGINFPFIVYVGSIEARKNLARLLEAYAQLRCWSQKWKLVIVGARKWKFSSVFETVRRLALEPLVHFTGYIAEEDLAALYNGADLFVFPSIYEGFGLPVLEAMACGTPVITSNSSSLPEVAGDAAILVDPHDVEAIASAMRCVLEDQALRAGMRARGLARAQQFTWERTARETIAVYERVLGEPIGLNI